MLLESSSKLRHALFNLSSEFQQESVDHLQNVELLLFLVSTFPS